ncbi:putative pectinesterase/pectinesterase inhibitor 20 [Nymphaea thermarum]|nr:putative pectinesterase/pectinesterase inhibitor 20 [Nymphaea thermarum]
MEAQRWIYLFLGHFTSLSTHNSTDPTTPQDDVDVQTWLSAIITNQQTCYDGLTGLLPQERQLPPCPSCERDAALQCVLGHGRPLLGCQRLTARLISFPRTTASFWEVRRPAAPVSRAGRRMALDTGDVDVKSMVPVAQDGSGNYGTIGEAIAAAPNNTHPVIKGIPCDLREGWGLQRACACFIGSVIDPSDWASWSGDFALSTLYYGEYNNAVGPGADTSRGVTWPGYHVMDWSDATNFTLANFLLGDVWLPGTSVPFTARLA